MTIQSYLGERFGADAAQRALAEWEIVKVDGGEVMKHGTEVHVCAEIGQERRFVSRGNMAKVFGPILEEFGFLTTRLFHGSTKERQFIERCGFRFTWSDGQFDYFMATELPFSRRLK